MATKEMLSFKQALAEFAKHGIKSQSLPFNCMTLLRCATPSMRGLLAAEWILVCSRVDLEIKQTYGRSWQELIIPIRHYCFSEWDMVLKEDKRFGDTFGLQILVDRKLRKVSEKIRAAHCRSHTVSDGMDNGSTNELANEITHDSPNGSTNGLTNGLMKGSTNDLTGESTNGLTNGQTRGLPDGTSTGLSIDLSKGLFNGLTKDLPKALTNGSNNRPRDGSSDGFQNSSAKDLGPKLLNGTTNDSADVSINTSIDRSMSVLTDGTANELRNCPIKGILNGMTNATTNGVSKGKPSGVNKGMMNGTAKSVTNGYIKGSAEGRKRSRKEDVDLPSVSQARKARFVAIRDRLRIGVLTSCARQRLENRSLTEEDFLADEALQDLNDENLRHWYGPKLQLCTGKWQEEEEGHKRKRGEGQDAHEANKSARPKHDHWRPDQLQDGPDSLYEELGWTPTQVLTWTISVESEAPITSGAPAAEEPLEIIPSCPYPDF